jgi:uncharacterized protein YbaP (TraB family)
MRRQIIVFFLSLFCLAANPALAADRGALFKVTSGGHSMYLFGTMHVGLAEFYPLEPRIAQAVANASTLALELDPAVAPGVAEKAMRQHGMAAAGQTMPPALAARLARVLDRAGINPAVAAPLKPWLVATMLAVREYEAQGYRSDLGVDTYLATLARVGNVKLLELESLDGQMGMFNQLSHAEQLRFLDESLAMIESGKQRAEIRNVVDAWRNADRKALDALAERAQNDASMAGRFVQQVLLDGRNGALADKLLQLLAREPNTVAAIGVLHLLGKQSVPALMQAKGVTVERVY